MISQKQAKKALKKSKAPRLSNRRSSADGQPALAADASKNADDDDSDDDDDTETDELAKDIANAAPPEDPRVVAAPKKYCKSVTSVQFDSFELRLYRTLDTVEVAEQALGGGEHGIVPAAGADATRVELMSMSVQGILARVRVVKDVGTTTALSMSSIEVTAGRQRPLSTIPLHRPS